MALVVPVDSASPVKLQPRWPCLPALVHTVFLLLFTVPLICLQLGEPSPLSSLPPLHIDLGESPESQKMKASLELSMNTTLS